MMVQTWVKVISSKRSNDSPRAPCMASTTASRSPHVWVTFAEVIARTLVGFQKAIATQHCKRPQALLFLTSFTCTPSALIKGSNQLCLDIP